MVFQSATNLQDLSILLFKRHLAISLPAGILIITTFFVVSVLVPTNNNNSVGPVSQHMLSKTIYTLYSSTVDYIQFSALLAEDIWKAKTDHKNILNLSETRRRVNGFTTGFSCLDSNEQNCSNFINIATVMWQFKTRPYLQNTIKGMIVCEKINFLCIKSVIQQQDDKLSIGQLNAKWRERKEPSLSVLVVNSLLLIKQTQSLVIFTILFPINQSLTEVKTQVERELKYNYLAINYPYQQIIYQISNTDQFPEFHQEKVQVKFRNGMLAVVFIIRYAHVHLVSEFVKHLSCFISFGMFAFAFTFEKKLIWKWVRQNFQRKELINKLYKYAIRDIFMGNKPNTSNILQSGPCAQLFKQLSGLLDNKLQPVKLQKQPNPHKQGFKFMSKIKQIVGKYSRSIQPLMVQKYKDILSNRFNIQQLVNEVCEQDCKKLKEYALRTQQLGIGKQFFKFAYLALLKNSEEFVKFVQDDSTAFPEKNIELFLQINQNINHPMQVLQNVNLEPLKEKKSSIEKVFKEQNKQQLLIRIRIYMLPKYLTILKELDSKYSFIDDPYFSQQIKNINETIQNTRHLLSWHDKTIRNFYK